MRAKTKNKKWYRGCCSVSENYNWKLGILQSVTEIIKLEKLGRHKASEYLQFNFQWILCSKRMTVIK